MLIVGTNGFLPQRRGDEGEGMRDEGGEVKYYSKCEGRG